MSEVRIRRTISPQIDRKKTLKFSLLFGLHLQSCPTSGPFLCVCVCLHVGDHVLGEVKFSQGLHFLLASYCWVRMLKAKQSKVKRKSGR